MGKNYPAKCPKCGSGNANGGERFEEGQNHKSTIEWWECNDCGCIYDESELHRWKKDHLGRLERLY